MLLIEHLAFGKIFIYLLLLVLIMCGAGICERECRCPQRSKGLDPTETGCEKLAVDTRNQLGSSERAPKCS